MNWKTTTTAACAMALSLLIPLASARAVDGPARPGRSCSASAARAAAEAIDAVTTWSRLYDYYRAYGVCTDGATGEGATEVVQTLLTENWKALPELVRLAKRDPGFETFVLSQLDETMGQSEAEQIRRQSRSECMPGARALCRKLITAIDAN